MCKKNKEKKNPFEALADIFTKQVKESDEDGFANIYKAGTEALFEMSNRFLTEYSKSVDGAGPFTFENVEYLDGYFIFGTGTNSVVHFTVKEIPGWKFGIWWEPIVDEAATAKKRRWHKKAKSVFYKDKVKGQVFAQVEHNIDKFKPSRSSFCEEFIYYVPQAGVEEEAWRTDSIYVDDVAHMLVFMQKEPDLAYYRDYTGTDFNRKFVSRATAKKFKADQEKWYEDQRKAEYDFSMDQCRMVRDELLNEFFSAGNAFIVDRGEDWSPRYDFYVKADAEMVEALNEMEKRSASYYLGELTKADDGYDPYVNPEAYEKYKAWEKETREAYEKKDHYLFSMVSDFVEFVLPETYDEIYENAKETGSLFVLEDSVSE